MALTKAELIYRLTNVCKFFEGNEYFNSERNSRWNDLGNAKNILAANVNDRGRALKWLIIFGIIAGILYFLYYYYYMKGILRIGSIIFNILAIINLLTFIQTSFRVKSSRKEINYYQDQFNDIDSKRNVFFSQYSQEINDANVFFPGDYYPPSRHIQYGINCLTSGRADDFKEFMNLIDDLAHREKLENYAQAQTENTRLAAANSKAALDAANAAAAAANRAANTTHTVYIKRY
jgi:hypothetical protein